MVILLLTFLREGNFKGIESCNMSLEIRNHCYKYRCILSKKLSRLLSWLVNLHSNLREESSFSLHFVTVFVCIMQWFLIMKLPQRKKNYPGSITPFSRSVRNMNAKSGKQTGVNWMKFNFYLKTDSKKCHFYYEMLVLYMIFMFYLISFKC